MHDYLSSLPTDNQSADEAYSAYWTIATSENPNVANSTSPVYRFARDHMLRTIAVEYGLSMGEIEWMYLDGALAEGPSWGPVRDMVKYGRERKFGRSDCSFCER